VPCESIRTFIYYLCSRGTKHCEILNDRGLTTGSVDVRLTGPLADDERNHLLRYRLTRVDIAKLKEAEKNLLVAKLIKHYPTQDGELHQEVCRALKAVVSRSHEERKGGPSGLRSVPGLAIQMGPIESVPRRVGGIDG
jgi:hypothetical protein